MDHLTKKISKIALSAALPLAILAMFLILPDRASAATITNIDLRYHKLVVDEQNKILPWYTPNSNAYDYFLDKLWEWLPTAPNASGLPMYYLYCGFRPGTPITPDSWENDWGERVPNFVEFGRLYYAYTGDMGPLNISKNLIDYALAHATTPSNYNWPNFPIGTANGGATEITGDNVAWNTDDVLIDLGSDMGMSYYKMYQIYGTPAYRTAAINTADVLAAKIQPGDANNSPWPYVVNARTGATRSSYTSNFAGALTLFDLLIENNEPNAAAYTSARQTLKNWILQYPMQNGNWVDGHSDNFINGTTNWSNTTKSNMSLYLLDNPAFDPNFQTDLPRLLQWTEDNFVNVSTPDGLPGQYYGASVPGEQNAFMYRMGYQTARQAAEYARWYAASGDLTAKDKAYRGFNYNTYMMKDTGEASDGPTDTVGYWWGDVYGEGARMYFHGFSAVPEWAPPGENHILYSNDALKAIAYAPTTVSYTASGNGGTDNLRLAFLPGNITVNGSTLSLRTDLNAEGYTLRDLGNGDYAVNIRRAGAGNVYVSNGSPTSTPGPTSTPTPTPTPPSSLAGYWKFDEISGTTALDSSGSNHPGTLSGSPIWTTGKVNNGLSFNGTTGYVSIGGGTSTLAIDPSSPATVKSNAQTLTTASFTPPAGSVLYITLALNSNNDNLLSSLTDNLGTHLTYTKQASYGTENGTDAIVYLYTAPVTSSQAMTVSALQSSTSASRYAMLKVLVATGANAATPVGAKGGGRGATGTITNNYTSTANGSWGWMVYGDWTQSAVPTVGANQGVYDSYTVSGEDTYALTRQNAVTANSGTSVTMNTTAPASGAQISHLYFEMIPAPGGSGINGVQTVSFWAKPNSATQSLIDLNGTANIDLSSGTIRANNFTSPTIYVDGVKTTSFPNTAWHFVTITTATPLNASTFNLGKIGTSYYSGILDEVKVYSRILSDSEIQTEYSSSFSTSDINYDGSVNILDLNMVAQHFNETTSIPYPRYDVNSDGTINILDIQAVARNI